MDFFKNNPYICCSMRQKVILFAALLLLTIPVHAQWVVGGSFSFRTSASNKTNDIVFRPDVSYSFGKVSVGATLTVDCYNFYDQHRTDWSLGITPYVQYYLWSSGVLSFFLEGGIPYYRTINTDNSSHRFAPYVSPGLEISITDHWSVIGYLGRLEYDTQFKTFQFSAEMDSFGVGVYYSF